MVAPGTAASGRSGDAADNAVLDSAPLADAAVAAAEADPAAVATLRELCCDGASPEFLAHVLMRRCHGDLEVHTEYMHLLSLVTANSCICKRGVTSWCRMCAPQSGVEVHVLLHIGCCAAGAGMGRGAAPAAGGVALVPGRSRGCFGA